MVNRAEREARELKELNIALRILRQLADEEGYIEGSPVEQIYNALTRSDTNIPLSRIRTLVTKLGELGWREEAWIGSNNVRGSKITLQPASIKNLEVLPAKVEREKREKEVGAWFREYHKAIIGRWTITNPRKRTQQVEITVTDYQPNKPRGRTAHWMFEINAPKPLPRWLQNILTPNGELADSSLYQLWKAGRAHNDSVK